jgi:hypothetical protein
MDICDEIAKEAYYIYEKSGCICGRDLDNWLEAERLVLAKEQMTGQEPIAVFVEEGVVEEIVSPEVKPAKKITTRKTAAKPKKEEVKKETKKTVKSTAKKKKE